MFRKIKSLLSGKTGTGAVVQTFSVQILILFINVGTGVLTARVLGASGRGEFAAIGMWPQLLAFTICLGLPKALQYNFRKYPEEEAELFWAATFLSILLGILASLIGIVFVPQWLSAYSPEVIRYAQVMMLIAPIPLLGITFKSTFEVRGEFTTSNKMYYYHPLATLLIIILLVSTNVTDPFSFNLAYALPQVPIVIWMFLKLYSQYGLRVKSFLPASRKLLNYGLRSHGIGVIGYLSSQIGQVLAIGSLTSSGMGMYTVALNLTRPLNTIQQSIVTVLFPKAASQPLNEVVLLVGRASRITTLLTFLCIIPLAILSPVILNLLYGDEFLYASRTFQILLLQVLIESATWILSQTFTASGSPGIITILQLTGLLTTIPLMLWLVPVYAMNGVAMSLLLSTCLRFVVILACYPLILKIKPPNLLVTARDIYEAKKSLSFLR